MDGKLNVLGVVIIPVFAALLVAGCTVPEEGGALNEMERFSSYAELKAAFEDAGESGPYYGIGIEGGVKSDSAMPTTAEGAVGGRGGAEYSTTNVQVEGVDEADIVKSDGRHIYNFSNGRLIITDAYPIEDSGIVSKTELGGVTPSEMFVQGDRLVVFGNAYSGGYYPYRMIDEGYDESVRTCGVEGARCPYALGGVVVLLYDISDRAEPKLEKEIEFEGAYLTSRLIGENAYFIVNSWPAYYMAGEGAEGGEENIIPRMAEDGKVERVAEATEIGYIPPMPARSFVVIASLNLESGELEKETIAGDAENVYASQGSIYLAATIWGDAWTPLVPASDSGEKTAVSKFRLDGGEIKFAGQGSVPGHVLNQFSMDEYMGNFRIATTSGEVTRGGSESRNNLYVLDEEMETIGKLEDLAPGEKIYSARFMGNKAYMVTFRKVDPLFVIDVSNPEEPEVLGKLKIPGYSDYLHPIDETHIIGVGKETIEAKEGDFAWYQGLKIAVFDVSDVSKPVEMYKTVIGDRGTDSYALSDHKAFLYDKEKELLVLPITLAEIPEEMKKPLEGGMEMPAYGEPVFQGAFVFRLTLENGFEERGRITHITKEEELKRGYYFGEDYTVRRALYIGDVLYTLSDKMLKANSLDTLGELKEFTFN